MWTQLPDLRSVVTNSGLRDAQQALDRDLRFAVENNRADRRPGHGMAGGVPPLTNIEIRRARDATAERVNDHLKAGRVGWLKVTWNWLRRLFRRTEVSESARKPRLATAEQVGAARQGQMPEPEPTNSRQPEAMSSRLPEAMSSRLPEAMSSRLPEATNSSQRVSQPSEPTRTSRQPITAAQVESWKLILAREDLRKDERQGLERAVAAAYLVSNDRGLQKLYADPQQLPDVADTFALADWVVERYEDRRRVGPPVPERSVDQQEVPLSRATTSRTARPEPRTSGLEPRTVQPEPRTARPERIPNGSAHLANPAGNSYPPIRSRSVGSPARHQTWSDRAQPVRPTGQRGGRRL